MAKPALRRTLLGCSLLGGALIGCNPAPTGTPPKVSIITPSAGQSLSGTVAVQVSAESEAGIARVIVYARGKGSQGQGVAIGSTASSPYVVSWYTPAQPNLADLEIYAAADDSAGTVGRSDPVQVRTSNSGSPTLDYLVGFSYPPQTVAGVSARTGDFTASAIFRRDLPSATPVRPPRDLTPRPVEASESPSLRSMAASDRVYEIEWGWAPVPAANGYGIFLSSLDVAGPYQRLRNQQATVSGGQGFSKVVDAKPGDRFWGAITPISSGAEGNFSNADDVVFLPPQDVGSPADGATVNDGRPILAWTPTTGAVGYLYYVYNKNPADPSANSVWKNFPQTTDALSAVYPSALTALPSGTYYWRVAAVSFNAGGNSDAYSFSPVRRFVVP